MHDTSINGIKVAMCTEWTFFLRDFGTSWGVSNTEGWKRTGLEPSEREREREREILHLSEQKTVVATRWCG